MRLLLYFYANEQTGLGHLYRMQALALEAVKRQYSVLAASDVDISWPGVMPLMTRPDNLEDWQAVINVARPDWVIVDLPGDVPDFIFDSRVCLIDGIGHQNGKADLVVSQGLKGKYNAPDYLLLRPGLFKHEWQGDGEPPLVWGGGADPMGLIPAFCGAMPDREAYLLPPKFGKGQAKPPVCNQRWLVRPRGDGIFGLLATSGKLITACGMICWEAAVVGVPQLVFSKTKRHLKTALALQELGYVLAYPKKGIPGKEEFIEFVEQDFMPSGKPIDGQGPGRVLDLLNAN